MCVYCEKHAQWGDYEVDNLSIREESKYNHGCYTGIQSFIDVDDNVLIMCAVVDDKNVKPLQEHVYVPINYCPKCGRKLGGINNEYNIEIDKLITYWKDALPDIVDYAEMVGAPAGHYGIKYVYEDPDGYFIENTIEALEELKSLRERKEV